MVSNPKKPLPGMSARPRALGILLAGGILFVLGFGGPSLLLSMEGCSGPAVHARA
jgi:hypothetical protein